jgi:aryl-alcohol dehydrogenase (NADP+)
MSGEGAAGLKFHAHDIARKYYYRDADHAVAAELGKLAQHRGMSNATLAYAWLLHQPGITAPIVGASRTWHIEQAVQALDVSLSEEELSSLAAPYQPHPVLGHSSCK